MVVQKLLGRLNPQQLMFLAWHVTPGAEFVVCGDRRLTRRQAQAEIRALARGLQALGIGKGDRVATLLPACPETVYSLLLPWVLGNVEVPLNPLLREHELRHILADCGARAVITTRSWGGHDYVAMLDRLRPDLPELRHVIVREGDRGDGRTLLSLAEVMALSRRWRRQRVSLRGLGRITYTSGTTGLPKGAAHSLGGYWGLAHPSVGPRLDLAELRCLLLPFPPYHYAGWLGVSAAFLAGGKVVLMERFDPESMLELIERERVTRIGASPTMGRLLLRAAEHSRRDLSSLRRLTLATEPCPPDLVQALHERLGCAIENYYGLTECGIVCWTGPDDPWERAATTVGRPAPGSRVRIVDDERRPLPVGQRGEIAAQTTQMMLGYYRDRDLSAQVLDADGWLYTGDVGYLGEDGYLRLVDRKKDVIIRGGRNIYPAEVEAFLERHPAIRRAGVVGVPSEVGGEVPWAYLELRPGTTLTFQQMLEHCRGQIAPYKVPAQVRLLECLPATATGKVQKFVLREMAMAERQDTGA